MSEMGYRPTENSSLGSKVYTDNEMVQGTMMGKRVQSQVIL